MFPAFNSVYIFWAIEFCDTIKKLQKSEEQLNNKLNYTLKAIKCHSSKMIRKIWINEQSMKMNQSQLNKISRKI